MRKQYYLYLFLIAGCYGCLGEIVIDSLSVILRGSYLWIYYNGFYTSWESFILFGLAGCLAFYLFILFLRVSGKKIIFQKENKKYFEEKEKEICR